MFNLTHITLGNFFHLKEDQAAKYLQLQEVMKTDDVFLRRKAKPLGQLTFGEVSQIKRAFIKPSYEKSSIVDYFYALNWIKAEVLLLMEKEKMLIPDPDPDLEMAGVKKLSMFGEMSTLINLAQKFSTSPMVIETWNYNTVFTILLYQKLEGEVSKAYNNIKK